MRVDVHGHIGPPGTSAVPPARISLYASACELDYVLVSNRAAALPPGGADEDEVDANLACLAACREHARLAALYWVRPGRLDSHLAALIGALRSEPFHGVVFAPADTGFDAADARLDAYVAAVAELGLPGLFCVTADPAAAPAKVYELGRRNPRAVLILCLCGATEPPRAAALDVVAHARRQDNAELYLDTSHASTAEIITAVRTLGADRVLFGTDALQRGDAHVPRHITALNELHGSLPPAEFKQVTGENAARLLKLPAHRR